MISCAYASALLEAVDFALEKNINLFSVDEVHKLKQVQHLPYDSLRILGRLLTRKSKWVKMTKLEEYLVKSSEDTVSATIDATSALIKANFMETLSSQTDFQTLWSIAEAIFASEDWTWLTQRLTGGKPRSGLKKDDVIRSLRKNIETQKTCFGTSLKDRFLTTVRELTKHVHHSDWVRLSQDKIILLRRTQRLLQAPSDVAGASTVSAFHPLEICIPLFVTFKLLRLPSYELTSVSTNKSWLFPNQIIFHQWEAAIELRNLLSELDLLSHQSDNSVSQDLHNEVLVIVKEAILCPAVSQELLSLFYNYLCPSELLTFTSKKTSSHNAIDNGHNINELIIDKINNTLPTLHLFLQHFTGLQYNVANGDINMKDNNTLSADELTGQLSVLGLLMFMSFTSAESNQPHTENTNFPITTLQHNDGEENNHYYNNTDFQTNSNKITEYSEYNSNNSDINSNIVNNDNNEEEYFLRFRAVSQLCSCVAHFAAECEKRVTAQYLLAVSLYELLLSLPVKYHAAQKKKRGFWCKRIIVNLDHNLKRPKLALAVTNRMLLHFTLQQTGEDMSLLESDIVDLQDRQRSLYQRLTNMKNRDKNNTNSNSINDIGTDDLDVDELTSNCKNKRKGKLLANNNRSKKRKTSLNNETFPSVPDFSDISNNNTDEDNMLSLIYGHLVHSENNAIHTEHFPSRTKWLSILILQQLVQIRETTDNNNSVFSELLSLLTHNNINNTTITHMNTNNTAINIAISPKKNSAQHTNDNYMNNKSGTLLTLPKPSPEKPSWSLIKPQSNNDNINSNISNIGSIIKMKNSVTKSSVSLFNSMSPAKSNNNNNYTVNAEAHWMCHICTFNNVTARFKSLCEMCGERRIINPFRSPKITKMEPHNDNNMNNSSSLTVFNNNNNSNMISDDEEEIIDLLSQESNAKDALFSQLPLLNRVTTANKQDTMAKEEIDVLDLFDEDDIGDVIVPYSDIKSDDNAMKEQASLSDINTHQLQWRCTSLIQQYVDKNNDNGLVNINNLDVSFLLTQVNELLALKEITSDNDVRNNNKNSSEILQIVDIINHLKNVSLSDNNVTNYNDNNSYNNYNCHLYMKHRRQRINDLWTVSAFTVHGRRQFLSIPKPSSIMKPHYLNPTFESINNSTNNNEHSTSNNTGKSRFYIAREDTFGTVEDLVQDKCRYFDEDETFYLEENDDIVINNNDNNTISGQNSEKNVHKSALKRFHQLSYCDLFQPVSGWQGWHCEGSLVRCLVGLLMWDCVFASNFSNDTSNMNNIVHNIYESAYTIQKNVDSVENSFENNAPVLLTKYQSAPLDFNHPSFYLRREQLILSRVQNIAVGALSSPTILLAEIERLYVTHRGCVSRHMGGMLNISNNKNNHNATEVVQDKPEEGGVSLRMLQLLALCLGPACLARLCLAVSRSHSQWRSGAPDLLLIRVSVTDNFNNNDNNNDKISNNNHKNDPNRKIVPLEELLGVHWQQLYQTSTNNNNYSNAEEDEDMLKPPNPRNKNLTNNTMKKKSNVNVDETNDVSNIPNNTDNNDDININTKKIVDPFIQPLTFPTHLMHDLQAKRKQLHFEAMFVEVKGPTDSLAYKQWLWLHLLNLRNNNTNKNNDNESTGNADNNRNIIEDCYYNDAGDYHMGEDVFSFTTSDMKNSENGLCAFVQHPVRAYVCLVKEDKVKRNPYVNNGDNDINNNDICYNRESNTVNNPANEIVMDTLEISEDEENEESSVYDVEFLDEVC